MVQRSQVLKAVGTVGGGQALSRILAVVRMAIIARMLSVDDFGIAATFVMTLAFAEMLADFGTEKVIVQARQGDRLGFQASLQLLLVLRGLLLGAILLALAWPIADWLFKVPEAVWAFRCLALIPVLRGFSHVDAVRLQRDMQFGPSVVVSIVPVLVATIAAWPILAWLGSYAAVLWLTVGQALVHLIVTHLVAIRPYRLHWNGPDLRYVWRFGWPLLISGPLLYGVYHGDRVIIGGMLSMAMLGLYTAALTLAQAPQVFAGRLMATLALPLLARHQDDRAAFLRQVSHIAIVCAILAGGMVATLVVAGGPLLVLIFGAEFEPAIPCLAWLVALQGVRLMRIAPNRTAMALGDTRILLICNVFRAIALGAVAGAVAIGGELAAIAAIGFFAELATFLLSVFLLASRWAVPLGVCLRPAAVAAIWPIISGLLLLYTPITSLLVACSLMILLGLAVLGTMLAAFPDVRRYVVLPSRGDSARVVD